MSSSITWKSAHDHSQKPERITYTRTHAQSHTDAQQKKDYRTCS